MKNISLILMLVFVGQVFAEPKGRDKNPLGLSDAQQVQMQELKQNQQERMKAAREKIMADGKVEMASFLTEDQMAQFEKMQEHRKEHGQMRKHGKNRKHGKKMKGDKRLEEADQE